MAHSEIKLKTTSGSIIYGNAWVVDEDSGVKPLANVVIAHGMAEYSFRYDKFARYLNSLGYNVYAVDQPGHGLNVTASEKPSLGLGVWPESGFKLAIDYLHELVINVRLNMLPTILFGHSMGSFVSQRYYQRFSDTLDGLILCGSSANSLTFVASRRLAIIMNKFMSKRKKIEPSFFFANMQTRAFNLGIKQFEDGYKSKNRWLSVNEENVQSFDKDPLCGFICSFNFYYNLFCGLKPTFQLKRVKEITNSVPILLIAGDKDPVGSKGKGVKKLERFYRKGGQRVQCILYPNLRHEILNEKNPEKIYADVATHIEKCIKEHNDKLSHEKHNIKEDIM